MEENGREERESEREREREREETDRREREKRGREREHTWSVPYSDLTTFLLRRERERERSPDGTVRVKVVLKSCKSADDMSSLSR